MRLIRLLLALTLLYIIDIQAQSVISLEDAIGLAIENNFELQKQKVIINKTESLLSESSRIPNPTFNYSREDLKQNNFKIGEWIASGSIPLNFLWDRWSNIESKEKSFEAQKLLLNNSKQTIIAQVKEAYLKYHFYTILTNELSSALDKINLIIETAKQRVKQGDIPEYDLQRILLEVNKFSVEIKAIEIEKNSSLSQLKLLIGYKDTGLSTQPIKPEIHSSLSEDELIKAAVHNRKDLKAVELLIESEKAFLSHNKLKIIPNINLTAGYKKQFDDYSGSIMQLSFEIPLFKRNQLEIEQSQTELTTLLKQKEYLINQITEEVHNSYAKYKQYELLIESNKAIQLQNLFSTAAYSYEQGETTLVEFIDGLNAYKDAIIMNKDVEIKYYQSFFELEKVSALLPVNENN